MIIMNNLKAFFFILICVTGLFFLLYQELNTNYSCEEIIKMNNINDSGAFTIDTIYIDVKVHSDILQNGFSRIKYVLPYFLIKPQVSDSIYKVKGVFEYVLIKKDSTYVQSYSCQTKEAFFVDKWKNGEKIYVPSSKPFPQPTDTSNSIFIK